MSAEARRIRNGIKIMLEFGIKRKEVFEKILPRLVEYAKIDKNTAPVTFFKLRSALMRELGVLIDEPEWKLFRRIRFLYGIIMDLSDVDLFLLQEIIKILLGEDNPDV